MHPKVARALRAARRPYADGGDVVRERATILPLGTYGDGTTRAAWPGVIYEPAAAAKRLVDYFMGGNYRPGDEDATRQLAEDSFTAASAVPVAGLAAAAVRPGVSLGSGGGRLVKGDMPTYKGYHATRDASKFVGEPEDRYIPSTMWMVGARDAAAKEAANSYVDHGLAAKAKAIIPVEGRFDKPLVVDAEGAKWRSIPFEDKLWRSEDLSREARNRGHDALVLENMRDHHAAIGDEAPTRVIAALRHGTVYDDYGNLLFSNSSKASSPGLAALESNRVRGATNNYTYEVVPDGQRFRWTVYRDGKQVMTGTRKREHEAKNEAVGSIKHSEKVSKMDRE